MTTKREAENSELDEETDSKKQKIVEQSSPSSPPQLAFDNALLPLASYDDDDEDEDGDKRDQNVVRGRLGSSENKSDSEEDDSEDEGGKGSGGRKHRVVEVRRDCPYLDTVNRQVILDSFFHG